MREVAHILGARPLGSALARVGVQILVLSVAARAQALTISYDVRICSTTFPSSAACSTPLPSSSAGALFADADSATVPLGTEGNVQNVLIAGDDLVTASVTATGSPPSSSPTRARRRSAT